MTSKSITAVLIGITSTATLLSGNSPYESDLRQLEQQHAAAVATAVEALNRRYQADLEQLLKRATQNNDLDAAIKINNALAKLGVTAPVAPSRNSPIGTWRFEIGRKSYVRTFHEDGTITGDSFTGAGTWKLTGDKIFISYPDKGQATLSLPLNPKGTKGLRHNGEPFIAIKETP
jgi:hypothetical protein